MSRSQILPKIFQLGRRNFSENDLANIFVKSSTGFYETTGGKPNGATFEGIKIMLDNAGKLPVKAAGGVRTPEDAEK
jgi:deoxyribose-phosphate aldolase